MTSGKLRDWLEIVGIFSVVASLVFVGLQMRQARDISLSQAYQARTTAAAEFSASFAANPVALSGYRKAVQGSDDLSQEEYDSLRRMVMAVMYLYDNAHLQYQMGFVSEEFWSTTRASMKVFMEPEVIRSMFRDRLPYQGRPEFQVVVRTIDAELEAEKISGSDS